MLDYKKYRNRFEQLFPSISEKERLEIFEWKIKYWGIMIENIDKINTNKLDK